MVTNDVSDMIDRNIVGRVDRQCREENRGSSDMSIESLPPLSYQQIVDPDLPNNKKSAELAVVGYCDDSEIHR